MADSGSHAIRKVVVATGEVTTLIGSPGNTDSRDGSGEEAGFANMMALTHDGKDTLFVLDGTVRKVAISTRTVTTVVGSPDRQGVVLGPLPASLSAPTGLALGPAGELYISDRVENAILVARF